MKPHVYIQSRVDSHRLPGKALLEINGFTTLHHVIERSKLSGFPVTVLTTDREVDDPIEAVCLDREIDCFRWVGPPENVLARFYHGAQADIIIRVTADCLGLDPRAIMETADHLRLRRAGYAYSSPAQGYPKGYGCEAFTRKALVNAYRNAVTLYDKEHVTAYMQRHEKWADWSVNRYLDINMELNTQEDFERIKNVYAQP